MKRKEVPESIELTFTASQWQVFKLIAFYGFDNMTDISMFCSITKSFYAWANTNVIIRCVAFCFVKQYKSKPTQLVYVNQPYPSRALLLLHPKIHVMGFSFIEPLYDEQIEEVLFNVIYNNYPLIAVRFGRESPEYTFEGFELQSFIEPSIVKRRSNFGDGPIERVEFYASSTKTRGSN